MNKLYLVSCDSVPVKGFAGYEKIKITLKPSQDFFSKALDVIKQTLPGSNIAVSGMDCLSVLKAQTLFPGHFNKIILIEPRGAFWWEDANNKPKEYFDAYDLFDTITCKVSIIGTGNDLPAWSTILKNADLILNWRDRIVNISDGNSYLELARLSGINTSEGGKYLVKGKAYTRTISSDIEWDEPDVSDPDKRVSSRSIISVLGWQWEKHWNVYTEEAPFGLMLSLLNEFLIECIRIFHYRPMYIEWSWNGEEFSLINFNPVDDYPFIRAAGKESVSIVGNEAWSILSVIDRHIMRLNEPYLIKNNCGQNINLDVFYACSKELGLKRKYSESFETKFNLFRYLKSIPNILRFNSLNKVLDRQEQKLDLIPNANMKRSIKNLFQERRRIVELLINRK